MSGSVMRSRSRLVWRRHGSKEHVRELSAVILKELAHTLGLFGTHNQSCMVMLLHAQHDFGSIEGRCVWLGSLGQTKNAACIILPHGRKQIGRTSCRERGEI